MEWGGLVIWCVVVAAGSGDRFGSAKQFERIGDRRVVDWAVAAAAAVCDGVVVVAPPDRASELATTFSSGVVTVAGGSSRSASVRRGLDALPADARVVLVHDAARPMASAQLFRRVVDAVADGADAAVPAVPLTDSIRSSSGGAVDRSTLLAVQTPQGFPVEALRRAHAGDGEATDDAALVEAAGGTVIVVEGEADNFKITRRSDLAAAAAILLP